MWFSYGCFCFIDDRTITKMFSHLKCSLLWQLNFSFAYCNKQHKFLSKLSLLAFNSNVIFLGNVIGNRVRLSSHLISRITGTIYVLPGDNHQESGRKTFKLNIGLNLKFNKKNEEVSFWKPLKICIANNYSTVYRSYVLFFIRLLKRYQKIF